MFATLAVPFVLAQAAAPRPNPAAPFSDTDVYIASALVLAIQVITQILGYWIAAKMLVPEETSFGKAAKLFITIIAGLIGASVIYALMIVGGSYFHLAWAPLAAAVALGLITIYVLVATPMNIYSIDFLRSLGVTLIAFVLVTIVQVGAAFGLPQVLTGGPGHAYRALLARDQAAMRFNFGLLRKSSPIVEQALTANDASIAADRSKPVAERQAAALRWRDALEARRVALDPKDQPAMAAYKHDAQEYSKCYHEIETAAKAGAKP